AGGTDAGFFVIDDTTGALAFITAPNFESRADADHNNIYDVTVQVSDGNGGIDTQAISVTVGNVNEAPTDIALSGTTVVENAANGTVIGTLSAVDPDAGDSATFSLLDDAGGRFTVVGNQLVVANGTLLDFEAATSHTVTVQATDAGGLSFSEAMTISLQNVAGTTLTGTSAANTLAGTGEEDRLDGQGGNDTLQGLGGNDTLIGGAGNDTLDGGTGRDTMSGGTNNDTYVVDNTGDQVIENAGEGTDVVQTTLGAYTLSANVETLTFTGVGTFAGTGNDLNNTLN